MVARIVFAHSDETLRKYSAGMERLSEKDAKLVMVRALSRGGAKIFTRVKRSLRDQLGASYNKIGQSVQPRPKPSFDNLSYRIEAKGGETNLNIFGARRQAKGVSAQPWRKRRVYRGSFVVPAYGGRVFVRTGSRAKGRYMRQLFGPNIARELVRDEQRKAFLDNQNLVLDEVQRQLRFRLHQIGR